MKKGEMVGVAANASDGYKHPYKKVGFSGYYESNKVSMAMETEKNWNLKQKNVAFCF